MLPHPTMCPRGRTAAGQVPQGKAPDGYGQVHQLRRLRPPLPHGAIGPGDVASVPGTCIKCQACVRKCTRHAKYFDDPAFLSHVAMLEHSFTEPKKNEVFL